MPKAFSGEAGTGPRDETAKESRRLRSALSRFADDIRAATAIEYSLIAGGVACAIAATVFTLGGSVQAMWASLSEMMP